MGNNKFHGAINLPNLMIWLTCCSTLMCHGAHLSFQGEVSAWCQWLLSTGQIYLCLVDFSIPYEEIGWTYSRFVCMLVLRGSVKGNHAHFLQAEALVQYALLNCLPSTK